MAEQIVIAELQINTKALQDSSTKLIQEIAKLKQEQKDLQKETNGLQTATEEQSRAFIENDARLRALNTEYSNNRRVLSETTSGVAGLNEMLAKEATTVGEAEKANKKLSIIRSQITTETQEGRDAIEEINKKTDENNAFIKENSDQLKQQKQNVGNYKDSIKEAFSEMNIFNGGIGGFIERSKEAGGTGNLLKSSFNGVKDGVIGATKASLGFIATPIGAVIAAIAIVLGILYSVFKSFNPVVDKAEQLTASLGAVFNVLKNTVIALVTGTKSLTEVFSNLGGSMSDAASAAGELKKAQQELEDQQDILEVQNAKASRQINELLLKSKDRTLSEVQRIKYLQDAQKIEEEIYNKNAKQADGELKAAQDKLIIGTGLTTEEIRLLRQKGVEYAKILQDKYALDDEDINKLKTALIKKENVLNDSVAIQEKAQNKVNALYEKADADREKAAEKSKQAQADAIQKDKEAKDKKIEIMNDELSLFIAKENIKSKTLEQSILLEDTISKKRIAILEKEYEFGKISKAKYDEEIIKITQETASRQSDLILNQSKAELDLFISQNVTKLEGAKLLSQALIDEESKRLESIKLDKLNLIEQEKKTNQEIIDLKIANNEQLSIADIEFLTAKNNLETEFRNQNKANQDAFDEQVKQQKAEQLIAQNEIDLANTQTQLEQDNLIAQQQYDAELAALNEKLKKESITKEQYRQLEIQANKKKDELLFAAQLKNTQGTLAGLQQLGGGLEALFGKSKALALAMAGINGAQAITSILAQYPKFDGGFAMTAALVAAGATTVAQIGKITSTKFEKGGLQQIGGNRHSAGGTKFVGEDGTRFEAEQGELIGVMNRNAARAFMDFNNAYPSGSSVSNPNVFASGGFVNQQSFSNPNVSLGIDYDLLAMKIGQANMSLPSPVVAVTDINYEQGNYAQVVSGANH